MSSEAQSLVDFCGNLHPLVVHLPVGGLVLLGALELVAKVTRFKSAAQNRSWILAITAAGAAFAALCGWVLSSSARYDVELLRWHKWSGAGVAIGCGLTLLCSKAERRGAYRACLCVTLGALGLAGHLGGSMTHGRGFLVRRIAAPRHAPVRALPPLANTGNKRLFVALIQPILKEHCGDCHGPEKQEADLRLDSLEALRQGGWSGPALVAGNARQSLLLQRVLLPRKDSEHMPPDGRRPLTQVESALLEWWVDKMATADQASQSFTTLGTADEMLR